MALLLFAPYSTNPTRKWLVFAILGIILTIIDHFFETKQINIFFSELRILGLVFYFTVIIHGFWYIIKSDEISSEDIFKSLTGYFMIAIAFYLVYDVFLDLNMIEFSPPIKRENHSSDLLYYSFTTLTTLGYGDILPVSKMAKRLSGIEAATGVLYVAVFIGHLIGAKQRSKK